MVYTTYLSCAIHVIKYFVIPDDLTKKTFDPLDGRILLPYIVGRKTWNIVYIIITNQNVITTPRVVLNLIFEINKYMK